MIKLPEQVISYPKNAPMNYINVSADGERVSKEDVYTQDTIHQKRF